MKRRTVVVTNLASDEKQKQKVETAKLLKLHRVTSTNNVRSFDPSLPSLNASPSPVSARGP